MPKRFNFDAIPKYASRVLEAAAEYAKAHAALQAYTKNVPWQDRKSEQWKERDRLFSEMQSRELALQRAARKYRF